MDNYTILTYILDMAQECRNIRESLGLETSEDELIALDEAHKLIDIMENRNES